MSTAEVAIETQTWRLLVVDDSRAMQAIIRRVLECAGLGRTEIRTVATGEEALAALEGFSAHLVISDWHMPKMTGIEMLQTLRQTGQNRLPVGFVTTEASASAMQQAQTNGAAFLIRKPFRDDELIHAVGQALGVHPGGAGHSGGNAAAARETRRIVQQHMPDVPFRVIENERFELDHLSSQNLLVLYVAQDGGAISAVAIANLPAVCMLGGGGGGGGAHADPKTVRQAIQEGRPDDRLVQGAIAYFRAASAALPAQFDAPPSIFKGGNLVPQDFAKVRAALGGSATRVDYRLSVPGYGDGRFVFIRA
jgi:CheY-like chemotaxis protein